MPKPKKGTTASKGGQPSNKATSSSSTQAPPPSWPQFKPPLPVIDLAPQPLEACPDKVVLIPNFWPRSLCNSYVAHLSGLPLVTTPGKPKRGDAVRVNDRFQVDDPRFAGRLWLETGLREALTQDESLTPLWGGEVVGLNSNIRIYRYSKGQYFDAHYDDSNNVSVPSDPADPASPLIPCKTTWTLLLYLTTSSTGGDDSGCAGGETVFYTRDRRVAAEEISVPPQTGLVLLHKHGDDCMLHEGREVTAGEKWIIRTDLCIRR